MPPKSKPKHPGAAADTVALAYRDIVLLLDASNMSGLLHAAPQFADAVWVDMGRREPELRGSARFAWHPLVVLYTFKLGEMAGIGLGDERRFGLAYDLAKRVNRGTLDLLSTEYELALERYYHDYTFMP